ncbi:hypothetical protein [Streptomyces sp. NPDC012756]|uniref:hypothetical protein n=1 Tax=Streptomyces sp. NPDC012756 TaxID=3364847 RepID=UPI00367495E2
MATAIDVGRQLQGWSHGWSHGPAGLAEISRSVRGSTLTLFCPTLSDVIGRDAPGRAILLAAGRITELLQRSPHRVDGHLGLTAL